MPKPEIGTKVLYETCQGSLIPCKIIGVGDHYGLPYIAVEVTEPGDNPAWGALAEDLAAFKPGTRHECSGRWLHLPKNVRRTKHGCRITPTQWDLGFDDTKGEVTDGG